MSKKTKWTLVFAWMIIIFVFSNQPAAISDEKSKFIIKLFEILGLNLNSMLGDMANFVVRKTAHFLEYFILCVFAFNAVYEERNLKKTVIASIIIVFLYSCSDEFHQLFIPGRASRFTDVIIDTTGGSLASLLLYFRKNKKLKR